LILISTDCPHCRRLLDKAEEIVAQLGEDGNFSGREILTILNWAMRSALDSEYLVPAFAAEIQGDPK
jgi:hypothetical protein